LLKTLVLGRDNHYTLKESEVRKNSNTNTPIQEPIPTLTMINMVPL
jgi:hypothetical protein